MEAFDYNSLLDFDETSKFLSALLKTVPSLEEIPEWNEPDLVGADIPLYNSNFEVSTEDTKNPQNFFSNDQFSSTRLASYSELIDSHFIASIEQSPNTTFSSPHASPMDMIGKDPSAFQFSNSDYQQSLFTGDKVIPLVKQETTESAQYDESAESDFSTKKDSPSSHGKRSHDDDESEEESKTGKKVRTSHRVIERNYRCNINSKINELRDVVPTLKIATGNSKLLIADLEGLVPASKLNKASVLSKAIEYIEHLQRKNDSLLGKIAKLHELVSKASVQNSGHNEAIKMEPSSSTRSRLDFGFDFNDNNLSLMYSSDSIAPENAAQAYPMSYSLSRNSNFMFGGMALSLGSTFITDENFRGLGAVPITGLFARSPMVASQLIATLRLVVLSAGILMMVEPLRQAIFGNKDKKNTNQPLILTYFLVKFGIQIPPPLSPSTKDGICDRLLGKSRTDLSHMIKDYAVLSSSEFTFENCLLTVLLGALLVKRSRVLSYAVRVGLKHRGSLLVNLEYSGQNQNLKQLALMVKTLDGLNLFESDNLLQRFENLSVQKPICNDVNSGENEMTYVDFYLRNRDDVFGVLYSWRVIELIHELNLVYLELLATLTDAKSETMKNLIKDTQRLEKFVGESGPLRRHLLLMKSIISADDVPSAMKGVQLDISEYLWKLGAYYQEPELDADDDEFSDLDEEVEAGAIDELSLSGVESTLTIAPKASKTLARDIILNKSILYSLNIVDEEKLYALVSSALCYYLDCRQNVKLLQLLRMLKFKEQDQPVSLFTLTCFVKLLCVIVKSDDDVKSNDEEKNTLWANMDSETCSVLESLVKIMRSWLNDSSTKDCFSHQLRSELSDLVVNKGLALNGI